MTFNIFSLIILLLAIAGMYLGWRASTHIARLLFTLWRLAISCMFALLLIYIFYCSWPYLNRLQQSGQVFFPVQNWEVVVR